MMRSAARFLQLSVLLCVALASGCHKNGSSNQPANTAAQPAAQPGGQPSTAASTPPPENPAAAPAAPAAPNSNAAQPPAGQTAAAQPENQAPPPSSTAAAPTPPSPVPATTQAGRPEPATPAPAPVVVPSGAVLRIRVDQRISVKTSKAGDHFTGTIVSPVTVRDEVVIPAGSSARGVVVESHRRGHFKGRSVLELTLTGLDVNGRHYQIDTSSLTRTKKGKGKRTAAFIGGGTGVGMLIGGVATGGVGLLIGGLSGAGAGTLGAAFTGNRDIDIPAETVMSFRLAQPIRLQ